MNIYKDDRQKLVDISFELVAAMFEHHEHFATQTHKERMEWVADQLRKCGFDTVPMGMSWGFLR